MSGAVQLSLMKKPQSYIRVRLVNLYQQTNKHTTTWSEIGDCGGGKVPSAFEARRRALFVVIFQKPRQFVLVRKMKTKIIVVTEEIRFAKRRDDSKDFT